MAQLFMALNSSLSSLPSSILSAAALYISIPHLYQCHQSSTPSTYRTNMTSQPLWLLPSTCAKLHRQRLSPLSGQLSTSRVPAFQLTSSGRRLQRTQLLVSTTRWVHVPCCLSEMEALLIRC